MRKSSLVAAAFALLSPLVAPAEVSVSALMGGPGFYGRIDIGGMPHPELIFPEPVLIAPVPVGVAVPAPIYVHVPPGQERKWAQHCGAYRACGRPVFFVRDGWYNDVYVPAYRNKHGHSAQDKPHGSGGKKGHGGKK